MRTSTHRLVLERARREERLHEGLGGGRVGPQGERVERRAKAEANVAVTHLMPNAVECTRRAVHRSVLQSTRQHSCCGEVRDYHDRVQVPGK